jgi:hypothetical protein
MERGMKAGRRYNYREEQTENDKDTKLIVHTGLALILEKLTDSQMVKKSRPPPYGS